MEKLKEISSEILKLPYEIELIGLAKEMKDLYRKLHKAWFREETGKFHYLSSLIFDKSLEGFNDLLLLPEVEEDTKLSDKISKDMGKALASAIHITLSNSYNEQRESYSTLISIASLHDLLSDEERAYKKLLTASRSISRIGKMDQLHSLLESIIDNVESGLSSLCLQIGGLKSEERKQFALGIRISHLSRKYALLSAACIHLTYRFSNKRKFNGIKKIADSRESLMRSYKPLFEASNVITNKVLEESYHFTSLLTTVDWIERPKIPYSFGKTEEKDIKEVRVHRKNMARYGICDNTLIYVRGKLEGEKDNYYLVSEMEGPGNTEHAIWEDYLAAELRNVYELYPGSLDMNWEFPPQKVIGAKNDLFSRI